MTDIGELDDVTVAVQPRSSTASRQRTTAGPRSRGSRVLNKALLWGIMGLAGALAFELTCRIEDWVMYRTPLDSPYRSIDDLLIRDADGMHGRPSARFQRWVMNSLGMRGPETSLLPAAGTIRVVTAGASETFGMRESKNREYPRQLQDSLNARGRGAACSTSAQPHFEVLNAAFAGMSLPTMIQDVGTRLARLRPDVVTAYASPVSYLQDAAPAAARPDSSRQQHVPGIRDALRSRGRDRVREQLKLMLPDAIKTRMRQLEINAIVQRHDEAWRFTTVPSDRLAAYEGDLRRIVGAIRSIGAKPVLVTHASLFTGRPAIDPDAMTAWQKFFPRATTSTMLQFDSTVRSITLKVGADSGVVVVDAAGKLAAAPPSAFADAVHFTDFGAGIVAGAMADGVLAARGFVHCAP